MFNPEWIKYRELSVKKQDYTEIQELLMVKREELTNRLERIKGNLIGGHSADAQEQAQEL